MKYDNMVDLAYKDVVENDEFTINNMFDYEDRVQDSQQSFDANYNKFYRERQKGYRPVIEYEPFECSESLLSSEKNSLEESLSTFESPEYRKKKKIEETLRSLFEESTEDQLLQNIKVKETFAKPVSKSLSARERFQQSLRSKSKKISMLEKVLLQTNN